MKYRFKQEKNSSDDAGQGNSQLSYNPIEPHNLMPHNPIPIPIIQHLLLLNLQLHPPNPRYNEVEPDPPHETSNHNTRPNRPGDEPLHRRHDDRPTSRWDPDAQKWEEVPQHEDSRRADTQPWARRRLGRPVRMCFVEPEVEKSQTDQETKQRINSERIKTNKGLIRLIRFLRNRRNNQHKGKHPMQKERASRRLSRSRLGPTLALAVEEAEVEIPREEGRPGQDALLGYFLFDPCGGEGLHDDVAEAGEGHQAEEDLAGGCFAEDAAEE